MILSTQYHRPPFPEQARWAQDLELIAQTGFDSIYVTAPWSWIEAEPGSYRYEDFDRLIDLAHSRGLRLIVNLWPEMQPLWIHRLHPDAAMIDHMGREVRSSQLAYMQFGLTPGCCTDHPQVRARAGAFLTAFASRYAGTPTIRLWDCWNEMRWMSQADGYVCFCAHTVQRYRAWLEQRYGTLDGLNAAWRRRYVDWADVAPPKMPGRTYTDVMLWQQFITDRVARELRWRYECVRAGDSARQIIAHAAFPSVHNTGEYFEYEPALGRGNDWQLAEQVDGYGCSHFPAWFHPSPADYGSRVEAVRCAAGDKTYWLAELQGGAAGHGLQSMPPVPADRQARWIWNGIARGAKAVNFWCWRDEVFGRESGGFGIVGDDGHSSDRLASLARTARLFREHATLLDGYRPAPARVGVIFEPTTYQLDWASTMSTGLAPARESPYPAGRSLQGYLRALERLQAPYDVVEPRHARALDSYRLLILPWPLVVDALLVSRLAEWVSAGGTLLTEASLDAFEDTGLFKYPAERAASTRLGVAFSARRPLDDTFLAFDIAGFRGKLKPARWREEVRQQGEAAGNTVQKISLGQGCVVAVGSFIGVSYWEQRYADFERFIGALIGTAGAAPEISCTVADGEVVQWRFGLSQGQPLLFVINEGPASEVSFTSVASELLAATGAVDITANATVRWEKQAHTVQFSLQLQEGGYHVLRFQS
jgi:beta-galactosidase